MLHKRSLKLWLLLHLAAVMSARVQSARIQTIPQENYRGKSPLPVVLWHGMGDTCCDKRSIGSIKQLIEEKLGVFVHSIATGPTEYSDMSSSYLGNINDQVAHACATLRSLPQLQGGYVGIGFSQGGQFMRALVQRCQHTGPLARALITVGGQHQGVATLPGCPEPELQDVTYMVCRVAQRALSTGAYAPWVRTHVVQAQYFKDPHRLSAYLAHNPFLPDINNELPDRNAQYAANLASLDRLVLVKFMDDAMVEPRDSSWFGFYNGSAIVPLREQQMYAEDWLGLRALDESGRLVMESWPGAHMQFSLAWFEQHVVDKYLRAFRTQ